MINFYLNGKKLQLAFKTNVLQALMDIGHKVPHFCYHKKLDVAGNCRMCMVEIDGKVMPSCTIEIKDDMKIDTKNMNVSNARKDVLDMLLINHPLDCPVCDLGGECDLQDISFRYGRFDSIFYEQKRQVENKYMGPVISTVMNRCIHCTRCIRFANDIAGVKEIGMVDKGENAKITNYIKAAINSEFSGNLSDICPVGALNIAPHAGSLRPWELNLMSSICIMDGVGANIKIHYMNNKIKRVSPNENNKINESWISDRTRFFYEGLYQNRIDRCYVREKTIYQEKTLDDTLDLISHLFLQTKSHKIAVIIGEFIDCETLYAVKQFAQKLQWDLVDSNISGMKLYSDMEDSKHDYFFNTQIAGVDKADKCLIIGENIKTVAPDINLRIRKNVCKGILSVYSIGPQYNLNYDFNHISDNISDLFSMLYNDLKNIFKDAKNPMIILGEKVLKRSDGQYIIDICKSLLYQSNGIRDDWNGFNILYKNASLPGSVLLDLFDMKGEKIKKMSKIKPDILYSIGADNIDYNLFDSAKIIYQGHNADNGVSFANIIVPVCNFTEKTGLYINTEGRGQISNQITKSNFLTDANIIIMLAKKMGINLGFNDLKTLREKMYKDYPELRYEFVNAKNSMQNKFKNLKFKQKNILNNKLVDAKDDFYLNNAITRNSKTMALCSREIMDRL